MKQNRKTKPMLFAFLAIWMTVVAACSSNNGGNTPATEAPTATQEATAEPTQEPEEPAVDLGGKEIRISHWWDATPVGDSESDEKTRERIAAIEAKYNVKIKYLNTDYGATAEKISSSVLANDPFAEVVYVPGGQYWGLMQGGFLTQVDDYLADAGIDPAIVDAMRFGGDVAYGMEGWFAPNENGIYYNKRMFRDAGLKDPQQLLDENNWNWTTFLDAAKKLTVDTNGDGTTDQYGLAGSHSIFADLFIGSNGGRLFDEAAKKVSIDSPQTMEALNFMHSLYNEHKVVKPNEGSDWDDPAKYFVEGIVAMRPGGTWEVESRVQTLQDEWGYVYFPKGPQAEIHLDPVYGFAVYVIPKGVENADVIAKIWAELKDFDTYGDNHRAWLEGIMPDEKSVANAMNDEGKSQRLFGGRHEGLGVKEQLDSVTSKMVTGEMTPSTGVAQVIGPAQAAADKVLSGNQ